VLHRGISIIKYKNDYRDSIDYKNGIYKIYRVNTEQYLYKNILIKSRFNVERKYIEERSFKSSGKRINRVSWWYWKDWWMDGRMKRREDRRISGEIQETTKRTVSHNGRLRSYFTQRRIRRWATIVKRIFYIV